MTVVAVADLGWADMRDARVKDPFADPDPEKRAEKAAETIDGWLDAIPAGQARER